MANEVEAGSIGGQYETVATGQIGKWSVTTGAGASVIAVGKFT